MRCWKAVYRAAAAWIVLFCLPLSLVQGAGLEPIGLAAGAKPPKIKKRFDPKLTTHARAYRIQGTVVVEGLITEDGKATQLNVISPLGYGLDERAVESVSQWKFSPATQDGAPISARVTIQVDFRRPLDPRRPGQISY